MRKSKRYRRKHNKQINIYIDKDTIKEAFIESYNEIKETERLKEQRHIPTNYLKTSNYIIFLIFKCILVTAAIIFIVIPFTLNYSEGQSISVCSVSITLAVLCATFAVIYHVTGKAIDKETDKFYVVAFFSSTISFSALIISLIGLLKEVIK